MKLKILFLAMTASIQMMGQGVIDVHSHIITADYKAALSNDNLLLDEGFPLPAYDVEKHLQWMDEAGVTTSVLTLAAPSPTTKEAIRAANEEAARIKAQHPGRFLFCASLPLPDVDAAIREAIYALDELHADGIKLATNANGQYLGAPELDTLFSVLNQRKAVVILHPHRPEPVNKAVMAQTPLAMQEYLSETTRAVCNMVARNVLARYSDVRVVVPHCGAYLPLAVPRMKSLTPVMQAHSMVGEIDWERNLSALYYDLAGAHSPETIRTMLTITTPDHLLYGSDYPYVAPNVLKATLAQLKEYLGNIPELAPFQRMILEQNARWLFSLTPEKPQTSRDTAAEIFRIADVEVYPEYLSDYLAAATEIQKQSLANEPGVVCLFPSQLKANSCQIRILEIYASAEAYQHHIHSAHFLKYKQETLHMVKSLTLNDMQPLNSENLSLLFKRQ